MQEGALELVPRAEAVRDMSTTAASGAWRIESDRAVAEAAVTAERGGRMGEEE